MFVLATNMVEKRNWGIYDKRLINRGRISVYFSDAIVKQYLDLKEINDGKVGRPYEYSNVLIFAAFCVKSVFRLGYRETQGKIMDVAKLLNLDKVPNYRTVNYRLLQMEKEGIKLQILNSTKDKKGMNCIIDFTGMKTTVNNEYRSYKYDQRKDWWSMGLVVNEEGQIVNIEVVKSDVKDCEKFVDLVTPIRKRVSTMKADGGFDTEEDFECCDKFGITPIIRIRKNANYKGSNHRVKYVREQFGLKPERGNHYNKKGNLANEEYRLKQQKKWKKKSKYGRRWIIEGLIGNFKRIFGEAVFSKKKSMQKKELLLKALVYNKLVGI